MTNNLSSGTETLLSHLLVLKHDVTELASKITLIAFRWLRDVEG